MSRFILLLVLAVAIVRAQPERLTPQDAEAFFDGLIPPSIERDDISGVAISIVRDGSVVFAKGYGFADVAAHRPVTADATLFRPGSISKLFTWTSVMQMVEQGKLDLDHDVNEYLDFKVPSGITMRHIMTHSSGLEETVRELFVPGEAQLAPLKQYLIAALPTQIYPPGKVPAYSNYATTLAGYIVQRLSGEPFDAYVANHILTPLGMQRTTFSQPLPDALKPLMSEGYSMASQKPKGFEFVKAYPAGSVSTTALDMTRFMMAHLNDGLLGDARILKPETARMMHTRQASPYPSMNAMALGFYEESLNGHRVIAHGGDTQWFHSNLDLILDANTGLFISQNSAGKAGGLRNVVYRKFMDRYFPRAEKLETRDLPTAKQDASAVAGYYMTSRREEDGFPYALNVASQLRIVANDDGTITGFVKAPSGELKKLHEVAPLVFRAEDSEERLAFRKDDSGNWEVNIGYPFMVFQRVSFLNHQNTSAVAGIFGFGVIALAILLWPVAAAVRWHYRIGLDASTSPLRYLVLAFCLLEALFAVGWISMANVANEITKLGPALDARMHFVQVLGVLAVLGIPVAIYAASKSWAKPGEWWFAKVRATGIALALLLATWFAWHWQLLNFSTKY